jgi:hypothetical protein
MPVPSLEVNNFLSRGAAFQTGEAIIDISGVQIQGVTHQPAALIHNFYIQSNSPSIIGFPGELLVAHVFGANQPHPKGPLKSFMTLSPIH